MRRFAHPYCNCWVCAGPTLASRWLRGVLIGLAALVAFLVLSLSGCATVKPDVTGPCSSVSQADALKALPDVTALVVCEKAGGDCTTLDARLVSDGLADAANLKACASSKVSMSTGEGQ